ncbi:MAG: NAD(P)H-hydrate dehydratase [Muribaculaceae bacterium]|nr:NAD(P)H-hydrate dehydratase [Muribaculaceae bacterium]
MKIFTIDDIRSIERLTAETQAIGEYDLVLRMAEGASGEIVSRWRPSRRTVVFAGPGNNGADALAVTRLLMDQGFRPSVYLFNISGHKINDVCKRLRDELLAAYPDTDFTEVVEFFRMPELTDQTLVIDGLFGSGLREPLEGGFQVLVRNINESGAAVVSLDVPSGMFPDWNPHSISRNIIHARLTLAAQFPHPAFFFKENHILTGEWKLIDIGLSAEAIHRTGTRYHLVEFAEVKRLLRPRDKFASKADYGHVALMAGSMGMTGAAIMAAEGAIRAGAGKVTVHGPKCGCQVAQTRLPEAMYDCDNGADVITDMAPDRKYDALAIGPGIGTAPATIDALERLLMTASQPLILDADALNCISRRPTLLNHIPQLSIITPHAGEFDRLFGKHASEESRLHKAVEMSRHYNLLIVLKGHYTALVRPDGKIYFNSSGTPALATPGSGDVLTGIIAGLMSQHYKPEVSALIGVYIHGLAGEIAARTHGQYGVMASDISASVGMAIKEIMKF